jgi:hypothetical protein
MKHYNMLKQAPDVYQSFRIVLSHTKLVWNQALITKDSGIICDPHLCTLPIAQQHSTCLKAPICRIVRVHTFMNVVLTSFSSIFLSSIQVCQGGPCFASRPTVNYSSQECVCFSHFYDSLKTCSKKVEGEGEIKRFVWKINVCTYLCTKYGDLFYTYLQTVLS